MFDDLNKAKRKQVADSWKSWDEAAARRAEEMAKEEAKQLATLHKREEELLERKMKGVTKAGLPRKHRSFARRADNPDGWMAAYESGRRAAASGISRIENPIRAFNRKTYAAWFLGYDEASVEEVFSGYGDSAGVSAGDSAGVITGVSAGVITGVSQGVVD